MPHKNTNGVFTFQVTIDKVRQTQKPATRAAGIIVNRLGLIKNQFEVSINDLVTFVTYPNSFSWSPSLFNGAKTNDNWKSQQVWGLDFDSDLTPEEAISLLTSHGIISNIAYTTFSDSPAHRKFRIIIIFDEVVTDAEVAKSITFFLETIFNGNTDKACKDLARFFYGGREAISVNHEINKLSHLLELIKLLDIKPDKERKKRTNTNNQSTEKHNTSDEFEGKSDDLYNGGRIHEHIKFEEFELYSKDFRDFINGKPIKYETLRYFAFTLYWCKGGLKYFESILKKYSHHYKENDFALCANARKYKYPPSYLSKFTTYEDEKAGGNRTLISFVLNKTYFKDERPAGEGIEVDIAFDLFTNHISYFLDFDTFKKECVYILPTALGKTQYLLGLNNVTIAFKTHALKEEFYQKTLKTTTSDRTYLVQPNIPTLENKAYNDLIKAYYDNGLHSYVHILLRDIVGGKFPEIENIDIEKAKDYIDAIDKIKCASKYNYVLLTTHDNVILGGNMYRYLIFDEDPINSLYSAKSFSISSLFKALSTPDIFPEVIKSELEKLLDFLKNIKAGVFVDLPKINIDIKLLANHIHDNISKMKCDAAGLIELLSCANKIHRVKKSTDKIAYIRKNNLPKNDKIAILSASASEFVWNKILPKCDFFKLGKVKSVGYVCQQLSRSYSSSQIRNTPKYIDEISTFLKNSNDFVITHKALKNKFKTDTNIHFFNCSGYNTLEASNITIIGTPNKPFYIYVLLAFELGFEIDEKYLENIEWGKERVTLNEITFDFHTFKNNKILQQIHLEDVHGELIQAVGRGRTLRRNNKVTIFSNLPLSIADEIRTDTPEAIKGDKKERAKKQAAPASPAEHITQPFEAPDLTPPPAETIEVVIESPARTQYDFTDWSPYTKIIFNPNIYDSDGFPICFEVKETKITKMKDEYVKKVIECKTPVPTFEPEILEYMAVIEKDSVHEMPNVVCSTLQTDLYFTDKYGILYNAKYLRDSEFEAIKKGMPFSEAYTFSKKHHEVLYKLGVSIPHHCYNKKEVRFIPLIDISLQILVS